MRLFYRLVILNLAVMLPMDLSMLRHLAKKTPTLSTPAAILGIEFVLLIANFAITWTFARQGEIVPLVEGGWRRFHVWTAWVAGPLLAAIVPFVIAALIIKPTFGRIFWSFFNLYWATSALVTVRRSQESQVL